MGTRLFVSLEKNIKICHLSSKAAFLLRDFFSREAKSVSLSFCLKQFQFQIAEQYL